MKNIEIQIRYECYRCEGLGWTPNPEYDPAEQFSMQQEKDNCPVCCGKKKVEKYITLQELLMLLNTEVEIEFNNEKPGGV